jgi:hypothetical protein
MKKIEFEITAERVRLLSRLFKREVSSEQAEMFLTLFENDLRAVMSDTARKFFEAKLPKKA